MRMSFNGLSACIWLYAYATYKYDEGWRVLASALCVCYNKA